jgi:hypothetical protein
MDTRHPRRRFGRLSYFQPVLVERIQSPGGAFALTRDVGLGGFAFVSPESMGQDQPVRATLSLQKDVVVAEGRVVWEHPAPNGRFQVGVEFTRMDPVHRALYRSVVAEA